MSDLLELSCGRFIRTITSSYRQKSLAKAAERGANIKEVEDLLNQIEDLGKNLSAIQPATVTFDEFPSLPPMSMYRRSLDSMPSYWDDSPSRRETRPPTNENCAYNARSPHLKCTVHPIGSCDGCKDFEQAEDIIPNRIPPELTRSEGQATESKKLTNTIQYYSLLVLK
jgi:Family of unknown function (DUF6464)